MLEPLFWMFKVKGFIKHFVVLFLTGVLGTILSAILFNLNISRVNDNLYLVVKIAAILLIILPVLFVLGYFWILTDQIINRKWDISSSNIYNGKIKCLNKIELPKIEVIKSIWRGVASIFASILLYVPFLLLAMYNIQNQKITVEYFNFDLEQAKIFYLVIYLFFSSFIPALAWNYAKRDSVVAVWNLPAAVFLIGTNPLRYWKNTILFIVITLCNSLLFGLILNYTGIIDGGNINQLNSFSFSNISTDIFAILYIILLYLSNTYILFVNAFLLGTLAPPGENY